MIASRRADLIESEVSGETLALDIESGTCFGFNPTASFIWQEIRTPVTFGHLLDRLTDAFDVSRDRCARKASALLHELHADGLVILGTAEPS